jgi:hypothetical protein
VASSAKDRQALNEALMAMVRGKPFEVPASTPSLRLEGGRGPGTGWGVRRRMVKARRSLEAQGFVVTTCVVGRKYKLQRWGVLPPGGPTEQDRLGLAAVLTAHRPRRSGPETGGVREPRRPPNDPGSLAAAVDPPGES